MKLKIILISMILTCQLAFSQGFSEIGTVWEYVEISQVGPDISCNRNEYKINEILTISGKLYNNIQGINYGVWNDSLFYEYNQQPYFLLSYKANIGDTIKVKLMPNFLEKSRYYEFVTKKSNDLKCKIINSTIQLVFIVSSKSSEKINGVNLRKISHRLINNINDTCANKYGSIIYGWDCFREKTGVCWTYYEQNETPFFSIKTSDIYILRNAETRRYIAYGNNIAGIYDEIGNDNCPTSIEEKHLKLPKILNLFNEIKITNLQIGDVILIYDSIGKKIAEFNQTEGGSFSIDKKAILSDYSFYLLQIGNIENNKNQIFRFLNYKNY